jgi:EAL domain-containing protein (putative c-di-GMP-specific phosphodiesterase class I)
MDARFCKVVSRADPERLVLELTEHARVGNYDCLARAMDKLRAAGMRIAIDDAGAGFSSLRHILKLRPDLIKLDLSLIRDINLDSSKQALAASLISFAEKSNATIVAEGIETAQELSTLVRLGVGYGQGSFLGEPVPSLFTT